MFTTGTKMGAISLTLFMMVFAYICGSFSSAIWVCKLFNQADPRTVGSKNPGATNVLRIAGAPMAFCVLVLDMLKGALPVYISYRLGIGTISLGIIAIATVLGHIYPLFFEFEGGKGIATAFGSMMSIGTDFSCALLITWCILAFITNYSSVASIVTIVMAPIYSWWLDSRFVIPITMLAIVVVFRHYDNIKRLINGSESKIFKR